jgi:hypothetical protein
LEALVFLGLALLHVYWAFGGRIGIAAAIPERDGKPLFQPGPAATLVVAALLLCASALILERAGLGRDLLPARLRLWGTGGLAAVFVARAIGDFNHVGFFKRPRATVFAKRDTRFFSPLALALGLGAGILAWGGH